MDRKPISPRDPRLCKHEFGFPVTDPESHRTYQVCVRCGVEYEYDWEHLTRLQRMQQKREMELACGT